MRAEPTRPIARRFVAGFAAALLLAAGLTVATDAVAPAPASAAQDPTSCAGSVALTNGSFEEPFVSGGSYSLFPAWAVPGWSTNDIFNEIEIWGSGFQGVPAASGNGFAELNANSASTLYQDVATTPGQTLSWSLKHRGRGGTDVMRVLFGAPGGPLVQNGQNLSDPNTAWGTHTGTYTVPAGQTVTRLAFEAVSSAGGSNGIGNFLDDINFGTAPCLITTKSVANLSRTGTTAEVGDTLRYTVSTRNDGGNPALESLSTDTLAAGLDFVPGSLRITEGGGAGTITDAAGDDRGEYSTVDRIVRVRLGDGGTANAGGSIGAGTTTTYTFDATVGVAAANGSIVNEARVGFRDAVQNQNGISTSQQTVTLVNPAADLAITKTLDTATPLAGQPVTFTVTATNNGPQVATGVTVTDAVPAGITDVTATSAGASCTVADAAVTCAVPDMAVDQSVPIEITGTLQPTLDAGTSLTNTASITGTLTDPILANNTASAEVIVAGIPAVVLTKTAGEAVDANDDGRIGAGDTVAFSFAISNTGTSVLRDIVLDDPLLGGAVDCAALVGLELAPDDEVACGPVDYVLTQQDLDAGSVLNTATVSAESTDGPATGTDEVEAPVVGTDGIELLKSAAAIEDANGSGRTDAGDTIAYTFAVTNTGTTTLSDIAIDDPRLVGDIVCDAVTLAPGEVTVCEGAPAVLTQAEVDASEVVNTASASGLGTGAARVSADASVTTSIQTQPAVALSKTGGDYADANGSGRVDAGDTVRFRFTVTNTGAVTLTDVVIDDTKLGGAVACDIPALAPGATAECGPLPYSLTAAEAADGRVVNVATVSAQAGALVVTAAASTTVDVAGLAVTGGVVTGIGWALALLILGLFVSVLARLRRKAQG
nr:isopeptide-forming domain-containing fimbrial protein [uncultured Microbacterium sp.]